MLLHARATVLRLQWELTRHRIPSSPANVQDPDPADLEELERDLKAARERTADLEREVQRLEAARSKGEKVHQREVQRLESAARSRRKRDAKRDSPKGSDASPAKPQ